MKFEFDRTFRKFYFNNYNNLFIIVKIVLNIIVKKVSRGIISDAYISMEILMVFTKVGF